MPAYSTTLSIHSLYLYWERTKFILGSPMAGHEPPPFSTPPPWRIHCMGMQSGQRLRSSHMGNMHVAWE
eukprot:scaffold101422_cov32-Tisochrysis_lutea.AAC.1